MKKPQDHPSHISNRKLAEWVSLITSALLILGVAAVLIHSALQPNEPVVEVTATAEMAKVQAKGERFVLPVRLENKGDRTVHDLTVEVSFQPNDAEPQTAEMTIDYLGEHSENVVYFYFEEDPKGLQIKTRPASYRLD
ncbi:MAG: hypothetical protein ACO1QR_09805 [Chthoniobacteraceae bacterium]